MDGRSRGKPTRRERALLWAAALAASAVACDGGCPSDGTHGRPRTAEGSGRLDDASVTTSAEAPAEAEPRLVAADCDVDGPAGADAAPEAADEARPPPLERIRASAAEALAGGRAERWRREGRLGPEDLTNDFATRSEAGLEAFSVLDADGYEGFFKCNLFALEMAYRAGLVVPVISRVRGWTYPGPTAAARTVEALRVAGGWARVLDGEDLDALNGALSRGQAILALGVGGRGQYGHLGLVESIHALDRAPDGRLVMLEYTGWEANEDGAHHRRRRWGHGRFVTIHLLELLDPAAGAPQVVVLGPPPDEPSLADAERLDDAARARAAATSRRGDMSAFPDGTRIVEGAPPRLPVAHGLLGQDTVFGQVVDVDRVLEAGEPSVPPLPRPPEESKAPPIDVGRVLDATR